MTDTLARPALTLVRDAPDGDLAVPADDPFIPAVAGALLAAGFPPERIGWLALPAPAALALAAAMGPARVLEASRW